MSTKICVFGASTTWGMRDAEGGGWCGRLRNYFEINNYDAQIYNLGIPGDTTTGLLKRFAVECAARKPQVIIFAIGANDACYINTENNLIVPLEQFQNNLTDLINQAKKFTDKIILVGLTKVDESKTMPIPKNKAKFCTNENILKYNSAIEKASRESGLPYVALFDLLDIEDLNDDGRHPNSQGHIKMFLIIKESLELADAPQT